MSFSKLLKLLSRILIFESLNLYEGVTLIPNS